MIKVAAVQVAASPEVERNLKKAERYLEVAARSGVKVACFPEFFSLPWASRESVSSVDRAAETADGQLSAAMSAMARRFGIALVVPFLERGGPGLFYNSALVLDSRGQLVGRYRKVHLPQIPFWEEKSVFTPGDQGFPVFDLEGVRIGVQLGWDHFFPEGFRCLALGGAQFVFVPTAAAFASQERWFAMGVGHAVSNGMFVLRVNRVGSESGLDFYGQSFVVKPDGELAAQPLDLADGLLVAECDPAEVEAARRTWPFLRDRRPRQYARVAGVAWGPELLPSEDLSQIREQTGSGTDAGEEPPVPAAETP